MQISNVSVVVLCLLVTACTGERVSNYCNDHRAFHAQHKMNIATLDVSYTGEGLVEVAIVLPANLVSDNIEALQLVDHIISMKGQAACKLISHNISQGGPKITASYQLDCGVNENTLKQVDIKLLDVFPAIEEVEADIKMPAVRKHFAINRQCEKPIFTL